MDGLNKDIHDGHVQIHVFILETQRNMKSTLLLVCSLCLTALSCLAQRMDDKTTHSQYIQAVDEYCPAPGQFINTMPKYEAGDNAQTMAAKCTELLKDNNKGMVCLGAWGGYITFHFDHSIANIAGQRDLYLMGNATQADLSTTPGGSSEPGIVMVSQDINGNGIPDDPWYEISGSGDRDSTDKMIYGYEVTYTNKSMQDTPWTDNMGNSGIVPRNAFHSQEYFPQWIQSPMKLHGTRLPNNGVNEGKDEPYWVLRFYDYGYVDNKPNKDTLSCSIDFGWAVHPVTRQPAEIEFVDFIRVYTGMQQVCGWLGETSTEFIGAEDLHLTASIDAIKKAITTGIITINMNDRLSGNEYYTLDGRRILTPQRGINIIRRADGTTRKVIIN